MIDIEKLEKIIKEKIYDQEYTSEIELANDDHYCEDIYFFNTIKIIDEEIHNVYVLVRWSYQQIYFKHILVDGKDLIEED